MLITEHLENNLVLHYSDAGFKIFQNETGELYDEAIDLENSPFTYVETNIPLGDEASAEEILDIILGGAE